MDGPRLCSAGLLLSGIVGPGLDDGSGAGDAEPDSRNAGAMWAAATLRPAQEGYGEAIRPIPARVGALCEEIGIYDADIESYVVSMLELQVYDALDGSKAAVYRKPALKPVNPESDLQSSAAAAAPAPAPSNLTSIAELLASHCDVDQDSIFALLVSIGPFD